MQITIITSHRPIAREVVPIKTDRHRVEIDGPKRVKGEIVRYQTMGGMVRRAIVLCKTLDGVNTYCVLPEREDGSFCREDNPVYIRGEHLWND